MSKQTAVEWLHQKHEYINWLRNRDEITAAQADKMRADALTEAKEIHKEQIIEAMNVGFHQGFAIEYKSPEDYYKQTYGGDKSQAEAKERAANYMRLKNKTN
jgi:hypothetical protein